MLPLLSFASVLSEWGMKGWIEVEVAVLNITLFCSKDVQGGGGGF